MDSRDFEKTMKKLNSIMEGVSELQRRNQLMNELWNRMPREIHSQLLNSKDKEVVALYLSVNNAFSDPYSY
jgi:hypothetical protein